MRLVAIYSLLLLFTFAHSIPVPTGAPGKKGGLVPKPPARPALGTNPKPKLTLGANTKPKPVPPAKPTPAPLANPKPAPGAKPKVPPAAKKRVACDTIASCKVKGKTVLDLVQSARGDNPGLTEKFIANYKERLQTSSATTTSPEPRRIKALLVPHVSLASTVKRMSINGKKHDGTLAYDHFYDQGVIIASNNFKDEDPTTPDTAQVNWNVVAFEGYKLAGFLPANLRHILRFEIANQGTKAVLAEVYQGAGKGADVTAFTTNWETWTLAANQDQFLGLLGTPNGNGAGFILSDYAATLGHRQLSAIYTRRFENEWSMLIEYST